MPWQKPRPSSATTSIQNKIIEPPVMQCYLVGGAVRDHLLGLPVKDRDFVVVGATPEMMLAQGFVPVGKDFPVFLHPQTHEQYALARTERKTAPGYKGFVFHAQASVTLKEDLARRDLTVNAIAQAEDGSLIDPFNGRADLCARVLRHVSSAFIEDPVRILRIARFCARFVDFVVAPETAELMLMMVEAGEADALVSERVWQEFSCGLMERRPSRMIEVLRHCGALARVMPALAHLWTLPFSPAEAMLTSLDTAASASALLPVRFAILLQAIAKPADATTRLADTASIQAVCARLKVSSECRDLAVMTGREAAALLTAGNTAEQAIALLERCDAFRKPVRFQQMLEAVALIHRDQSQAVTAIADWCHILPAALEIDAGVIAQQVQKEHPGQPMRINAAIRTARIAAVRLVNTKEINLNL